MQQGRLTEGLEQLETAVRLAPDNPQLHEQLGQAYRKLGRTADAEEQFATSRRLQQEGRAHEAVRALLAWLGALSLAAGVAAQPVSKPQSAAKPPSAAPSPPVCREAAVRRTLALAHEQSERKDLRGALETLRQARALAPNSEEVLYAYAEASLAVQAPLVGDPGAGVARPACVPASVSTTTFSGRR